jgi:hypothetical protein
MPQNDFVIANADGATVRADLNSALQALAGLSSGASAPTTTYAYQPWLDTANNLLKLRDGSNAAWIAVARVSGANLVWQDFKGADIASAATTDIGAATGQFVSVTGTTTITALGTADAGTFRIVHFAGALTLTHNATTLILPGAANIATSAGDVAGFVSLGSGNWRCLFYTRASGVGRVVAASNTQTGATATGSTVIPLDDTIPQSTEGDQYMALSHTPRNASNLLRIDVRLFLAHTAAGTLIAALFKDSDAGALAVAGHYQGTGGSPTMLTLTHWMTAGTTAAISFKVRAGSNQAGTTTFNGSASARLFGGVLASSINVTEIAA